MATDGSLKHAPAMAAVGEPVAAWRRGGQPRTAKSRVETPGGRQFADAGAGRRRADRASGRSGEEPDATSTSPALLAAGWVSALVPATIRTAFGRSAPQQDAVCPDHAGHHHRRVGRDRDRRNQLRLARSTRQDHVEHGRQHAHRAIRCRGQRRRQLGHGQRKDAHARRCRCRSPTQCHRGGRRRAHRAGQRPGRVQNRNWIPTNMTGTTPDYLIVRDWQQMARRRDVHRARRAGQQQGVRHRTDAGQGAVSRRIADRQGRPREATSRCASSACWDARAAA